MLQALPASFEVMGVRAQVLGQQQRGAAWAFLHFWGENGAAGLRGASQGWGVGSLQIQGAQGTPGSHRAFVAPTATARAWLLWDSPWERATAGRMGTPGKTELPGGLQHPWVQEGA